MSEVTCMEELIEGLEKCVAEEIVRLKSSISTLEHSLTKKLKALERQIADVTLEDEFTQFKEYVEGRLESMHNDIKISGKIVETKLEDFQKRQNDIDAELKQLQTHIEAGVSSNKQTLSDALSAAISFLNMDDSRPMEPEPSSSSEYPNLQSPPLSFIPASTNATPTRDNGGSTRQDKEGKGSDVLQKYMTPSTTTDKLNQMQRAFFKYYVDQHQSDKANEQTVQRCIEEGIEMGVWTEGWSPDGVEDFALYLKERIRNERKYCQRMALKKNQKNRFSAFMKSSHKRISVQTTEQEMDED